MGQGGAVVLEQLVPEVGLGLRIVKQAPVTAMPIVPQSAKT